MKTNILVSRIGMIYASKLSLCVVKLYGLNRNGTWKCSPSLTRNDNSATGRRSYPSYNMQQYQTAASRCSTLSGVFEGAQADNRGNGRRIFDDGDQVAAQREYYDEVDGDQERLQALRTQMEDGDGVERWREDVGRKTQSIRNCKAGTCFSNREWQAKSFNPNVSCESFET
jgi:hypothetical protein